MQLRQMQAARGLDQLPALVALAPGAGLRRCWFCLTQIQRRVHSMQLKHKQLQTLL